MGDRSEMREMGERLRVARASMGMTRTEASLRARVGARALSHYETGRRQPSALALARLALTYGVSADWIVGDGEMSDPHPRPWALGKSKREVPDNERF